MQSFLESPFQKSINLDKSFPRQTSEDRLGRLVGHLSSGRSAYQCETFVMKDYVNLAETFTKQEN